MQHVVSSFDDSSIGVRAGHWTDERARTGCTVVLFDRPAVAVADLRGGAPGTREVDVLGPGRLVRRIDALLLTGGSAFGLAAADGVTRYLADDHRGVQTRTGPVPIVPSAVIYDLAVGEPISPDAASGRHACEAATNLSEFARGQIGVGAGATTSKTAGMDQSVRGGVGLGRTDWSAGSVTAICVVNAFGDVVDPASGVPVLAKTTQPDTRHRLLHLGAREVTAGESTTIAAVLIDAPVDHSTLVLSSIAAHDALAHTVRPCHTIFDGDIAFAVALREGNVAPADAVSIAMATELAVEQSIIDAVTA
jgi:L-aminopeptidase/D-esterase-like protein